MALERFDRSPDLVDRPRRVPGVTAEGGRPERLLRPRTADEDRQVGLDRARLAERIDHPVETAVVAHPLAVEEAPHQHDRLVEPVEALAEAGAPFLEAERLVLALEPGPADPEDCPSAADVVERRGELRRQPRIAERVRPDHEPEADARRDGGRGREGRPALEDRLLPGTDDREQVIPGPERVPAGRLGGERRVAELRPGRPL